MQSSKSQQQEGKARERGELIFPPPPSMKIECVKTGHCQSQTKRVSAASVGERKKGTWMSVFQGGREGVLWTAITAISISVEKDSKR